MKKAPEILLLILFLLPIFFAGCSDRDIVVSDLWIREAPPGMEMTAMYLTLKNNTPEAESLLSVETEIADKAEFHETYVNEEGISRMRHIKEVEIPPSGKVALEPGGKHVMLIGLRGNLIRGDDIGVVLRFRNSGTLELDAKVKGIE